MNKQTKSEMLENLLTQGRTLTEAEAILRYREKEEASAYDPNEYQNKARAIVKAHYNDHFSNPNPTGPYLADDKPLNLDEIYVVWFVKVLQNWKALVSTTRTDGQYFELTYNGDKEETYMDTYVKLENTRISDEFFLLGMPEDV